MILKFVRWWRQVTRKNAGQLAGGPVAAVLVQEQKLGLLLLDSRSRQVMQVETLILQQQTVEQGVLQLATHIPGGTPVVLVLSAERYQLLTIEKPAVPAAEIPQALPWLVKDLLPWPLEDVVLDYQDDRASAQPKIQVVAAQQSYLQPLCKALHYRQKNLVSIVPDEWLALHLLPKNPQAVLLLAQPPGQDLMVQIVRDGQLLVSRKLRGFSRISDYSLPELTGGMLDSLLLEVQRSLDYFEAQLRQPPVREIQLLLSTEELPGIIQYFAQYGFAKVCALPLQQWMPALDHYEQHEHWLLLAASLGLLQEVTDEVVG
jgi:MSHA biogenesis protein MshI